MNPKTHYIDGNGYITKRKTPRPARVDVRAINRRAKETLKRCPGCGTEKIAKGMVWCDCNPGAPFRMGPAATMDIISKIQLSKP